MRTLIDILILTTTILGTATLPVLFTNRQLMQPYGVVVNDDSQGSQEEFVIDTQNSSPCSTGDITKMETSNQTNSKAINVLFDFETTETSGRWAIVNDGVMGGLSQSGISLSRDGTAIFEGAVSLENYGGFASVRTNVFDDLGDSYAIRLRVLGDGRTYKLRLRTDAYMDGPAYEAEFETIVGEWLLVEIPYTDMKATYRGRAIRNAPTLEGAMVQQIGLMIADKTAGPFRLEIDWIKSVTSK